MNATESEQRGKGLMTNTVKELNDRSSKGQVSVVYCDIKKKIMIQQANTIGHMIQGRF